MVLIVRNWKSKEEKIEEEESIQLTIALDISKKKEQARKEKLSDNKCRVFVECLMF